jgi:hypothetical protein
VSDVWQNNDGSGELNLWRGAKVVLSILCYIVIKVAVLGSLIYKAFYHLYVLFFFKLNYDANIINEY